jgi:glycosyltransferase involved in cell wall biosynthesis
MPHLPLKILHYIPVYAPAWKFGGPVLSVSQLCEGLVQLGHEVEVFTSDAGLDNHRDIPLGKLTKRNGVWVTYFPQVSRFGIHSPGMEEAVWQRATEFDLIHITGVWQPSSYQACKAAYQFNIPYVVSLRGALGPYSWGQKTLKKIIYYLWRERFNVGQAAGVHYTTQQEFEECRWLQLPGQPMVIPNGLDTDFWQPHPQAASQWRHNHGIAPEEFVLLNVGRLHHKKGLDLLPTALAPLKGQPWKLVFVGGDDDGTKRQLQHQFHTLKLTDQVLFLEACSPEQLPAIYSGANLFVLPSRHENFGNVVVEALACGCPILISDRVGLYRELSHASVGWVLPRNPTAWTNVLQEILESVDHSICPPRVAQAKCRAWVQSECSLNQTTTKTVSYYHQVISSCSMVRVS